MNQKPTTEFIATADQFAATLNHKIDSIAREFLKSPDAPYYLSVAPGYTYAMLITSFNYEFGGQVPASVLSMIEMASYAVGQRIKEISREEV